MMLWKLFQESTYHPKLSAILAKQNWWPIRDGQYASLAIII